MSFYDNILQKLSTPSPWSPSSESAVLEPFTYLTSNPGKDILDRLIDAFDTWMKIPSDSRAAISKVVNMLHNASLMVDDIEDTSQLRRGKPVAHSVYGVPQTLNAANYVYFLAYHELLGMQTARLSEHELIAMVTDELLCLHRGQGLELLWRDSLHCPTEEEYVDMVNNKTGGLLRIAIKLMMACATTNVDEDYVPLINLIGIYYQIRDDLMNLQSPLYSTNKGFAEDLTEGKFSFPIVHGVRADPSNREIINVLQKRPSSPTRKTHAIEYLKTQTRSFDYTLSVLGKLEAQARAEVVRLGGNTGLDRIVDALHVDGAALGL
ncbi:farnesyltranstransferase [Mycena maculata]|uniref:(2E,6E)-farnesyl diphosphate synthase n=1 Tax=Mycena maculata TaxID=230809 RepID=A0AAD7P032_9AGAR|nr:farnesyltranstransferase [Mycena maculata]